MSAPNWSQNVADAASPRVLWSAMERRANERYRVWFPLTVVTDEGQEGTAISYDVSASGLLMACPGSLQVGDEVTLRFKMAAADERERAVRAKVLRVEATSDPEGPWRYRMAVEFAEPQPDLEGLLEGQVED